MPCAGCVGRRRRLPFRDRQLHYVIVGSGSMVAPAGGSVARGIVARHGYPSMASRGLEKMSYGWLIADGSLPVEALCSMSNERVREFCRRLRMSYSEPPL